MLPPILRCSSTQDFGKVLETTREYFITEIIRDMLRGVPGDDITRLSIKQDCLNTLDITLFYPENCTTSNLVTGHLVAII